jgi:predicted XRE-type DNA-binding protein
MTPERRAALEAKGYRVYDHAGDAVGMTEDEKQEMDLRIQLSNAIRKRRKTLAMSQQELATLLKTSQARVSKIEWGKWDVPIDQLLKAYAVLGGRVRMVLQEPIGPAVNGHTPKGAKQAKKKASKVRA